jgi:hypothetical protein
VAIGLLLGLRASIANKTTVKIELDCWAYLGWELANIVIEVIELET